MREFREMSNKKPEIARAALGLGLCLENGLEIVACMGLFQLSHLLGRALSDDLATAAAALGA